jgi:hypothetical protein
MKNAAKTIPVTTACSEMRHLFVVGPPQFNRAGVLFWVCWKWGNAVSDPPATEDANQRGAFSLSVAWIREAMRASDDAARDPERARTRGRRSRAARQTSSSCSIEPRTCISIPK